MLRRKWTTPAWRKMGTKNRNDWSGPPGPSTMSKPPKPQISDMVPAREGVSSVVEGEGEERGRTGRVG